MIIQKIWWFYTTTIDPQSKVIESDSSDCNFRDALIAPVIGFFHGIHFFTQQTVSLLLPFVYQIDPYFVNSIDICSSNEITKTGIYNQKGHNIYIYIYIYILSLKRFDYFFSFYWRNWWGNFYWEKHFLFINITKFRFLIFFSDRH